VGLDLGRIARRLLEELLEPPVVVSEKAINFAGHESIQ
jgi:hypothetical protein